MATIYFIGIGSNISPKQNVISILKMLFPISPRLHVSRIVETKPVGLVNSNTNFLNGCVALTTTETATTLKAQFNMIETQLGRDRTDPQRGVKNRPADLDILLSLSARKTAVSVAQLPTEPYIRPMTLELLHYMGIKGPNPPSILPQGTPLQLNGLTIGQKPITLIQNGPKIIQETISL